MIEIGRYNDLMILIQKEEGLILSDDEGEKVLLPSDQCPENYAVGDPINVFVFLNSDKKKVATSAKPKILLDDFAFLKVVDVTEVGAFLDWGMEKDLLVPYKEQREPMEEYKRYVVYLDIDEQTDRLYASSKIEQFLQQVHITVSTGDEVEIMVYQRTDLGYLVIINEMHQGLVYKNEIFQPIKIGDKLKGYIKTIRPDNKIDVSLQPIGYSNSNDKNTTMLYERLVENGGYLKLTDKSDPQIIYDELGISKKAFKRSVGALYKERKITIEADKIKLV